MFCDMSIKLLNKHSPIKKIQKRQSNAPCYKIFLKQLWKDRNLETI